MFWEKRLASWISSMRSQAALPLRVQLWNGRHFDLSPLAPEVTIRVPRPSALAYLLNPSLANLGRAYVEGKLEVEGHLKAIIDVANVLAHRAFSTKPHSTTRWLGSLSHTRHEDAAAIAYHYDVSNAFYAAFLDPGMVYSCSYFDTDDQDLATAQLQKIDHILTKIRVRPGDRLLDIGCGWGSLVMRAAENLVRNVSELHFQRISTIWRLSAFVLQDYQTRSAYN